MEVKMCNFQQHGDERGQLVALEETKEIPFRIKRVYYMYDTGEGVHRGFHAHKNLEQILICVHGSCKILLDSSEAKINLFVLELILTISSDKLTNSSLSSLTSKSLT